jgi:hypothetical protein
MEYMGRGKKRFSQSKNESSFSFSSAWSPGVAEGMKEPPFWVDMPFNTDTKSNVSEN